MNKAYVNTFLPELFFILHTCKLDLYLYTFMAWYNYVYLIIV